MDFQENLFEGSESSGYYRTATYDDNGNILELRIIKNKLTKWFYINLGAYLVSKGCEFEGSRTYYTITPCIVNYPSDSVGISYFVAYPQNINNDQAFHQISPNYSDINFPSGGGFGGVIYIASDIPLECLSNFTPNNDATLCYGFRVSSSGSFYMVYSFPPSIPIDCYTSGNGLFLDVSGNNVIALIKGSHTFSSDFLVKCLLTVSSGKPFFGFNNTVANVLTYCPYYDFFTAGQTIFVEWRIEIQV